MSFTFSGGTVNVSGQVNVATSIYPNATELAKVSFIANNSGASTTTYTVPNGKTWYVMGAIAASVGVAVVVNSVISGNTAPILQNTATNTTTSSAGFGITPICKIVGDGTANNAVTAKYECKIAYIEV